MQHCRSWDDKETSASPGLCADPADFYFCGVFAGRGDGEWNRRAHCMLERWSCLSTCCSKLRDHVGHAFDAPDICIISYLRQWDLGDKT